MNIYIYLIKTHKTNENIHLFAWDKRKLNVCYKLYLKIFKTRF